MQPASTRAELHAALQPLREGGRTVAFVPTMGALHQGHAKLMAAAHAAADVVVVSIFVNPLQFGPREDLASYPRALDDDLRVCEVEGVDVVFIPSVETVYPGGRPQVTVDPGPLGRELEGASRPGHFSGVLTVVVKLLGLVRPEVALFGEKDYQQLVLLERCVSDLCLGVDVVGVETYRDPDGLATSSRNRYLDDMERLTALALNRALRGGAAQAAEGSAAVLEAAHLVLADWPEISLDYLELRSPDLGPAPRSGGPARLLVAARVGPARLIDNVSLELGADVADQCEGPQQPPAGIRAGGSNPPDEVPEAD